MITMTHANGYTGELRDDGFLFITDAKGSEVMTSKHSFVNNEETLMEMLKNVPSFISGIAKTQEKNDHI